MRPVKTGMKTEDLLVLLRLMNFGMGALTVLYSFCLFFKNKSLSPLFIALAIITAGPLEDLLMRRVSPKYWPVIDQLTSLGFLVFLFLAVLSLES
ncbi:hypothetical protein [Thermosediminibacter oceani]|uniref:Uncharacterized protein n=1 Tax=Thermosediminibacter oceani (strain ATCC BAA-1034 / DSM 16646 / JW/IW-1228P) TaxID=555079 RepID=D9S0E6_THEOJ|nr:hypothetical protein [Thermosediminibacter oceani]ADL08804.1 hypothetical protein Toce_2089 [Thermosediminibacter oceani DSM 16646]